MTTPQAFDPTRWRAFEHESWQSVAKHYHEWLGPVSSQAIPGRFAFRLELEGDVTTAFGMTRALSRRSSDRSARALFN